MQMVNTVVMDGWTLLVVTCGGYSRLGGDFRTEVCLIVEGRRVFSRPQLRFEHPDEGVAREAHNRILRELAERHEITFGKGEVLIWEKER